MLSRDDVLRMAREASKQGGYPYIDRIYLWRESHQDAEWLERFAALVAAAEREAVMQYMPELVDAALFPDSDHCLLCGRPARRAVVQPVVCPPGDDGGGDTVE